MSLILVAQVYAIVETTSGSAYLVRLGDDAIEWLAKIGYSNSGTFDRNGDFFVKDDTKLYRYSGVKALTGHSNKNAALDWSSTKMPFVYDFATGWSAR